MARLQGLAPVVDAKAHTLILGSFPGEESLRRRQYYAHSQNGFWKIMTALFAPGRELKTYEAKKALLKKNGIALWDVIGSCERQTSADSRIKNPEPNDFERFLKKHKIRRVLLNGRTAEKYWRELEPGLSGAAQYVPSTSPAYAVLDTQAKTALWRQALRHS